MHYIYFIARYSFTSRNVAEDDQSDQELEDECEDPSISQEDLVAVGDSTDDEPVEEFQENPELDNRDSRRCSPDSESQSSPAPTSAPAASLSLTALATPDVLAPVLCRGDPGDRDQEFTLDGPTTCIGRKRKARNLQDMLEVCTCGQRVTQEEISSGQNIIRCTSKGCETQWVSCDLDNRD